MNKEEELHVIHLHLQYIGEYLRQLRTKFTDIQQRLKKIENETPKGGD